MLHTKVYQKIKEKFSGMTQALINTGITRASVQIQVTTSSWCPVRAGTFKEELLFQTPGKQRSLQPPVAIPWVFHAYLGWI